MINIRYFFYKVFYNFPKKSKWQNGIYFNSICVKKRISSKARNQDY